MRLDFSPSDLSVKQSSSGMLEVGIKYSMCDLTCVCACVCGAVYSVECATVTVDFRRQTVKKSTVFVSKFRSLPSMKTQPKSSRISVHNSALGSWARFKAEGRRGGVKGLPSTESLPQNLFSFFS